MWRVKSYQSPSATTAFDLDNGNYYAYIEDKDRMQVMPTIEMVSISRGKYSPTMVGKMRKVDKTRVTIRIRAADEYEALKDLSAACANDEDELGTLTVVDRYGTEWTIQANVVNILRTNMSRVYEMPLDVPDLIWRKVAVGEVWNVAASGEEYTVTNTGNRKNKPTFKFESTAVKTDGFLYQHWVSMRNPNEKGYSYKSVDITDGGVDSRDWVKDTGNYVQINNGAGITNSQTTIPYDTLTGAMPTYGMGYIDNGVNQEQVSWTGRTGTTSGNLTGVTRGIGGTTARAFADNVKIYLSYCQADMRDVRVYRNTLEQNIWIDSPNTASTKIWIVVSEPPGVTLELGEAISAVGTITEITLARTTANYAALNLLPVSGVLRFNNEAFHYTDRDPTKFTVDVDLRSLNGTTAGSHSIGDVGYLIANDYWLYTGNPFLDAQDTNDTREPMLDKTNSDNETRAFLNFGSSDNLRADSWRPEVGVSLHAAAYKASQYYGGDHIVDTTDPYEEMGMVVRSIYKNGAWKYETGMISWEIYEPGGISQVTSYTYERYRVGPSYPENIKIEKSKDGVTWELVYPLTAPTASGSWGSPITAGPHSIAAGYYYLRVMMWGSQVAGSGLLAALEVSAFTYKVDNPIVPEIMARQDGVYEHDFRILNQTTDEYFRLHISVPFGDEVEVDCDAKTVTTLADNKKRRAALFLPNTQREWMSFAPGDNDLKIIESGLTGMKVTISQQEQLAV
jgi:hypothetical protein